MGYIAIKNTEHKGVYEEKGFNKSIFGTKGISHRKFKCDELDNALKWAGVKDLKTGVVKTKQIKAVKPAKEKIVNDFEQVILGYAQDGNEAIQLELVNGHKIYITTRDIYYRKPGYSTKQLFYTQYYDSSDGAYKYKLDEDKISRNIDSVGDILKTKLEFFNTGIKIENYGQLKEDRYSEYSYPSCEVYIPNTSILMVEPLGVWSNPEDSLRITEKEIINAYKKSR